MSPSFRSFLAMTAALAVADASFIRRQSADFATVDLSTTNGEATFLGSGWIYGFPDNGVEASDAIPDSLVTDLKFHACRAGGAQTANGGWAYDGEEGYNIRFSSTLSNYRTTRKYDADFLLLPHDLWGADGGATDEMPFPGDNGDWSNFETFFGLLIQNIKDNDMLDGLVMDLWNEPDGSGFWHRSWDQYLEYYNRATAIVRRDLPNTLISGPSMAWAPNAADDVVANHYTTWMSSVAAANATPDIYSWHQIAGNNLDPDHTVPQWKEWQSAAGLPDRPIDMNEYAEIAEQNPGTSAFYLAQLERHNVRGLRANWGGGDELHDYLAALTYKDGNSSYYPNGEWQLYKYYADMVGDRVPTTASSDYLFDAFAVKSTQDSLVKIIAGTRLLATPYDIHVTGLSNLGLSADGSVDVRTLRFDWSGAEGEMGDPVDLGTTAVQYSDDTLVLTHSPPDDSTAFAYEFGF